MPEQTGSSYEGKEQKYARMVDASPWNAHYERPAVVSLLPPLENATALDVGCGPGWYTEYLVGRGATVTAIDLNREFVALTRKRLGQGATVLQVDLTGTLDFASDGQFDVVVCPLVLHYLKDWGPTLQEIHRVLKIDGVLVFSTHHPFDDWKRFDKEDYFALELLEEEWDDVGKITFYRRPLTAISEDLSKAGFLIERFLEPQPTEEFRKVNRSGYELLSKSPWFIVIRAVKRHSPKAPRRGSRHARANSTGSG